RHGPRPHVRTPSAARPRALPRPARRDVPHRRGNAPGRRGLRRERAERCARRSGGCAGPSAGDAERSVTYAQVLLFLVLPAIAVSAAFARRALDRRFATVVCAVVAVAFLATFPWDAQAVRWGIWHFDPAKTCGVRLGVLPIEECAFFVLQTVLVAL